MRLRVQVVIEADDDEASSDSQSAVVHEVATIERGDLSLDTLGLQLAEAKDLLQRVQEVLIDEQARGCLAEQIACPHCHRPRAHKDSKTIVMRTLFGTVRLASPRWRHCACQSQPTRTFCPLAAALPERTTPELRHLESKFAGLVSYGQSARLLAETLPLGRSLHASAVRLHTLATAERLESELGPEQPMFAEGCQREWDALPRPDLSLTVGLDGGYVHSSQQRSRRDGWFEVIAGKSMPTEGPAKCFGFVQTYDTKPKRRLFEVLRSQGMRMNQQVTFFTDGGNDVRELPLYLNPQSEQYLDWFHLTMRITVMSQLAKGVRSRDNPDLAKTVLDELERLKWFLWHGNVYRALETLDGLEFDLDVDGAGPEQRKLLKAVTEFGATFRPTQRRSRTTVSGIGTARPSQVRSSSRWSTRSSASGWSSSSRCAGHPRPSTCSSRFGPGCSTRSWPASSSGGIQRLSPRPSQPRRRSWPRSLPQFCSLSG